MKICLAYPIIETLLIALLIDRTLVSICSLALYKDAVPGSVGGDGGSMMNI